MSGTINRTATIPGVSSNSITIVTAQPGGNVTTTQTIKLIPTQPGSSRNFPPIKTITVVKGQPGGSSVHLPPPATEPEFTAELLPSSSLPVTETVTSVTAESGQGHAGAWNFESLEEKNPLSELSEEHLNKLDEVLASADVQEILQQSVGSLEGAGDQSGSEPVELQECDLSVLSAAFTDHAYAVHPDKAPKSRPVMVTTTSKPKPIVVTVGPNEVYEKPAVNVSSIPSVVPQSLEPPSSVTELYPSSPSSVDSSPRKSGRSSKARKFDDEDWVTSSPRRGRGRGLIGLGTDSPPGYGNKRQSSRIEDQKQRELAEKILQANRQALEAEKLTGSSAESFLGGFDPVGVRVRAPGLGSQPVESEGETGESDVDLSPPKGRGRGRGRGRGKKSSDDEKKVGKQTHDNLFDRLNDNSTYSGLNESTASSQLDTTIESDTEKTTDDVKTTEVSDVESDNDDDNDSVGDKKETVKKKPGKKRSMWDTKRRKKKKKAPKVREKVTETETEATMDSDSDKSDVDDDDDDVKDNSKTKKVGKKGKKVGKVKEKKIIGKKDKGKDKKSNVKAEDSDVSDMETDVKSKEKKTLKKLSKKERLKKLKEAKKAKKAKLLEKKKAKLKEKKLKKGKAGKGKESAAESDKSPKKKKKGKKIESDKKKGVKDLDMESASDSEEDVSTKKSKKGQASSAASPVKKKKGKASDDKEETKGQGQAKKKKLKASEETEESEGQGSPKKKKAKLAKDKVESPVKGKKGKAVGKGKDTTVGASPKKLGKQAGENKEELKKSPTKAGKRKELEETSTVPTKKQKIEVDKKAPEGIRSDSDDDVPLQKIKSDIQEENTPLNQIQKDLQAETKASIEVKETSDTLTPKTETVTKIDDQTIQEQTKSSLNTEIENKDSDSVMEPVTNDQSNEEIDILTVETDNNMLQESLVDQKDKVTGTETMSQVVNITNDKTVGGDKSVDKNEGKRRHSDDRDTSESRSKKRDSRDSSKDHRKHSSHHHRHSRDSRESSHDRKDTHKDRKDTGGDSKERRKSGSSDKDRHRTDSHDRKGSVSKEGKDSKKALKKDERQSSVGVPNSEKKKLKTPGKVDKKKVRKSIDDRVDSLWTDLFTPDVTPSQKGKLKKESSIDKSGAATKKTASDDKSRTVSEKDDSVSSIDSALNKPENKDTVRESSIDRSDTSIFDKFKDLDKMVDKVRSDKSKAKDIEADKGGEKLKVETNENEKVETPANNESKSEEISEIKSEMKDAVTNAVDDLNSASQKTEIKDEKPISASQDAKTDQDTKTDQKPVKDEKFVKTEQKMVKDEKSEPKIKDEKNIKSEPKIIKGDKRIKTEHKTKREERDKHDSKKKDNKDTVQKEIKKEKESYDKEKLQKKLKDKAKRMKEKLLESNEKDKKGYKKEKMSSKQDRSRSLSSDKGRKLSPDKSVQVIRVSSLEELEKHRKLSEETAKKKHMSGETSKPEHGSGEGKSRPTRNKAVAFAEILKKEKLGSDDNDEGSEDDSEYNDDEADETWEDPGKLYCLCRQPHNKRFMICCDKCEEWFHGKCVGITRARGEEMEKNDEEYICPQCSEKEEEPVDTKAVVTSTESPDQSHKKSESKETSSLSDSMEVTSTHEGVEKSDSLELPRPDSTVQSPIKRDSQDSHTSPRPHPGGSHTPQTPTRVRRDSGSPRKLKSPDSEGGKGYIRKRSPKDVSPAEKKKRIKSFKPEKPTIMFSQRKCLCGCNRLARVDSLFWGKECELRNEELRREEAQAEAARKAAEAEKKLPQEKRVAVVEKGTGKTLTGHKAPRESELQDWLQRHPTFEVLKSHRRLSSKDSSRDRASDSSEVSDREKSADDSRPEKPLPRGPEPVRLNVRKGLRDALAARADAADDIVLSNSEIKGLALTIEEEMFKCFKDTDHKYKAKYRSLVFNIKDHKNKGLFRKILNRRIRPYQLVRMTPEELASQELSKWREHETKHQLEMIEQTEEALLHEHPHIMKKTHKGEEEVEAEGEEDLSSLAATEPKKEELSVKIDPKADVLSSILPDTTDQHGKHLFDSNCSVCTGKIVPHPESSETSKTTVVHEEPQPQEVEPEPTQKEKDRQAQEVVKEVLKAIKLAQAEADREKAEAQKQASSVTVRSPDSALSSGLEKKAKFEPQGPQLWKGFVYMQDVSKFVTSAYRVTGPADHLDLPDTIHVCGRINPEHVWDYLAKVKQAASRDICVIRFIPGNNEEKAAYINLYSYLNSRSRCGVVQNSAKHIKDFYIVPLPSHSRIPSVLKPFDGPGLEENRCHMLIGVIIRNKTRPGSHSHTHKHDPRKLKSNLKDPAPEKPASSSSSSPTSSTSSATPQDKKKKKKAKSISFDPIVKEYSHVASDQEETPDVSYDPSAPYDPEKEAEATKPKQEDRPYSPGQEEFGTSESLMTSHKSKTKDDPVSKMIEKIALSKNPVEATATMVAALATSSRLGNQNQRKLLLELTKKVDEQKKALEKKRLLAASGKSPSSVASPSEKSGTTDNIGSTSTSSPHSNKSHMNRNDPRLMPKKTVESAEVKDSSVTEISTDSVSSLVAAAPSVAAGPTVYSPLKDLQASRAAQTAAQQQQTMAKSDLEESKTDNKDNDVTSPAVKPFSFTVKSKSHPVSKSVIEDDYDEDKIKLHKLDEDEDETVFKPKGFYVDHEEKVSPDQEQAGSLGVSSESNIHQSQEDIVVEEVVASETVETNDTETLSGSDKDVQNVNNGSEETKSSEESMEDKLNATDKTVNASKGEKVQSIDFDIISHLQAEVSGSAKSDTVIPKSLQMVGLLKDKEAKEKEAKDKESKEGQALDILSQLHASVWGSKSNKEQGKETGQGGDKSEPGTKSSQLQTDSGQSPVKLPQNILNILKEVTDKPGAKAQPKASESQQQQAGQLPKSLLSLFSGIPSGSKSASDSKTVSTADVDLRPQAKKSGLDTTVKKPVNPTLEAKPEVKVTKEKLSKSLAAFDYDSDSDSEGSFEGFDDDGLKSLSPRKRKLVAKQSPARADSDRETTNEFGDVDIRVPPKQGGLSKPTVEEPFGFPAEDVDLRQRRGPSDVDHRMPVGRDERNQTGAEFLPPGEELQVSEFPADVDERIQKPAPTGVVFSTPGVVFTTPDAVPIRPPPLHDVDHRQMPFPPPGAIPPGMRPLLPFMGSNQPPPPGEDWVPGQPAPPPLPLIPAGEPPPLPEEVPKEILPPLPVKPPKDEIDRNEPDKTKVEERATDDMKDKADDGRTGKDKKGKKKKKKEKKKGELMASDEILKARVLEIARNEPIEPPPLPPILGPSVPVPVPGYSGAPPPMAVSGSIAGSVPISGPPAARMAMQGPQGPVLSQPQTLNSGPISQTQTSYPVSSQNMSYPQGPGNRPFQTSEGPRGKQWQGSSEGQQMPPKQWQGPQDKPQMPPQAKKWQGPPARASPGPTPPSLFDIEVKPTKKLVVPPDGRSPSSSNVQPKLPPSKQDGLLPMPDLPQNVPRADQGLGLGPGQFNRQPGPSTVSSLGPNPFSHHDEPGGTHGSTEGHDAIPPHGSQEFGDDRGSWDRCHRDRHRDRQDRHSGSRERDSDRHRQDHHRDDRDYHDDRDYRSNRAISDRHSSERYSRDTDRHDRSDRHSSERQGRDYDRHREDYRSDHRSGDRHDDHHRRDDRGDHHRRRGRDDYNRHDRRSRH